MVQLSFMKGAVFSGTVIVSTHKHTNQFFFFLFFFPFPQTLLHLFSYAKADGYTKWRNPAWGDHIFQIPRLLCKEWAQGNADSKAYIFFFPLESIFLLVLRRITSHMQALATQLPGLEPAGIDLLQVYIHFIMLEWQATCLSFFYFFNKLQYTACTSSVLQVSLVSWCLCLRFHFPENATHGSERENHS